jgi:hypothetical protein
MGVDITYDSSSRGRVSWGRGAERIHIHCRFCEDRGRLFSCRGCCRFPCYDHRRFEPLHIVGDRDVVEQSFVPSRKGGDLNRRQPGVVNSECRSHESLWQTSMDQDSCSHCRSL